MVVNEVIQKHVITLLSLMLYLYTFTFAQSPVATPACGIGHIGEIRGVVPTVIPF